MSMERSSIICMIISRLACSLRPLQFRVPMRIVFPYGKWCDRVLTASVGVVSCSVWVSASVVLSVFSLRSAFCRGGRGGGEMVSRTWLFCVGLKGLDPVGSIQDGLKGLSSFELVSRTLCSRDGLRGTSASGMVSRTWLSCARPFQVDPGWPQGPICFRRIGL